MPSSSTSAGDTAGPRSPRRTAVIVAIQLTGVSDAEHGSDIVELERLVRTLDLEVVATVTQRRESLAAAAVVGEGKLKELAELTGGKGVVPSGAPEVKTKARAKWDDAAGRHSTAKEQKEEKDGAGGKDGVDA
ncbi:MAG: hypothetical protein M3O46_23415, partial [Myxococcota bacterium]|nr:hypothetical protein [Myxococcota bacterium]